ncbi:hypothetical protein DL96DRAFT_1583249 [Flagelloscypha sp. PMI_526]|nr:hypothetical protein DL96DRAFT_1583249 [Flagelloscypha sp. PMI_526]
MESNKDEALRCLSISQKHRNAQNYPSARKFALKSLSLFETPEAKKLLEAIETEEASAPSSSSASSNATGSEARPPHDGAKHRQPFRSDSSSSTAKAPPEPEKRDYTPEQLATVKRVTACKITEYYEILSLKKDCEEAEVKKAYRKLALGLHPDKNGAPGADEAFKMVSKAFQVLSDPQKRASYDASGGDPEDRFGGMRAGGQSPFGNGGGMAFDGELNPEDLFNMFFGGGLNAGGPVFTTTFGPGGFRTVHMGGGRRRTQAGQQENAEARSPWVQLAPLLILFAFTLLSNLPSLFTTPSPPDPSYSFTKSSRFTAEQLTSELGIQYHVNPSEIMRHPVIGPELQREGYDLNKKDASGKTPIIIRGKGQEHKVPSLAKFEKAVETRWTNHLYNDCQQKVNRIHNQREAANGFFGFGVDYDKLAQLEREEKEIHSCNELRRFGIIG